MDSKPTNNGNPQIDLLGFMDDEEITKQFGCTSLKPLAFLPVFTS